MSIVIVIWNRIRKDIQLYYRGVLLAAAYIGAANLLQVPFCPMVLLTGLPCPGCGMTRAAVLFFQGHWLAAWQMHPFFYVLLALAAAAAFSRYVLGRGAAQMKAAAVVLLMMAVFFYGYRMARDFPDREPMVYFSHNGLRLCRAVVAHFRQIW